MEDPRGDLFAESAHAKQFNDDQIGSYLREIQRLSAMARNIITSGNSLESAYQKEYKTPGTIEHEAHKVIEPYLINKYGQKKPAK